MVKDQEFLKSKASYCLDLAKKMGATDASVAPIFFAKSKQYEAFDFRNSWSLTIIL